jgi:hypothetical protein
LTLLERNIPSKSDHSIGWGYNPYI